MLKVVFLTGEYPPMQGGIADHTAHLAHHLIKRDVAPSVLVNRRWQETEADIPTLFAAPEKRHPVIYPLIPDWGWRCWPAVAHFLETYRPDVLHIQYQAAAFDLAGWLNWLPWYLKRRQVPVRIVTTFHDLRVPYVFPKAGPLRWRSILALARHSQVVICTNREDLHILQQNLPAADPTASLKNNLTISQSPNLSPSPPPNLPPSPRLTLIPLGSNVEPQPPADFERAAWRKKYQATDQTLLLAYFGFLNESKGGEELIEALGLLRQQGIETRLLFIGGEVGHADATNVAYARRVQGQIERLGLANFVYRTGYIDLPEVSASLLAADAVVMPYRDGVSFRRTTLIAALRHGCPVISTRPANPTLIPEIVPGQNMLLAEPGQAADLAEAIAPLATNLELRATLASGAKQLGDLFEWQKIAGQTRSVYRQLSAGVSC